MRPARSIFPCRWSHAVVATAALTLLACSDDEGESRPGITPSSTAALDVPQTIAVPPCPALATTGSFVRRTGDTLELDGRRFRAVGANLYYLQSLFAEG